MSAKQIKRTDGLLPPPDKLAASEPTIKVTLRLNVSSVIFFKEQARKYSTKYQTMLRSLVDMYVERYSSRY